MAWWAWVLVVLLGPSVLIATVLLPFLAVELLRGRSAGRKKNLRKRPVGNTLISPDSATPPSSQEA